MDPHPFATAPADSLPLESLPVEPLLTAEFDTDPAAVYERLRRQYGPVAPVGLFGVPAWLVLDYREVLEVLSHQPSPPKTSTPLKRHAGEACPTRTVWEGSPLPQKGVPITWKVDASPTPASERQKVAETPR